MKMKTSELAGNALDYAVALCEGYDPSIGDREEILECFQPHIDWSAAGPIIEREKITIEIKQDGWWLATMQHNYVDLRAYTHLASSPLIAAMRCYVASKLGGEINIPEELTK